VTPENLHRALRSFARRTPFQPFLVELHNGRRFRIIHPEAVQIRDGVVYHISPGDEGKNYLFDHESVCLICDVEEEPVTLPPQ
jgi:hypothetical protein